MVYAYKWCVGPTRDTVMITISAPTSNANAGSDQQICGSSVSLTAYSPSIGTGQWSQITGQGGALIANQNSNSTIVN